MNTTTPLNNFINNYLNGGQRYLERVFVLGNVSCDLDSFLSSYLLCVANNFSKHEINQIYIPIINCPRKELKYRFDLDYLTKRFSIDTENMNYIDDDFFKRQIRKKNKAKFILVDHNRPDLSQRKIINEQNIIGIYDHHKDEGLNIEEKTIIYPLGSCSSLILKKFYENNFYLFNFVHPLFAVSAMLNDTENFDQNLYNKKWTNFDKNIFDLIIYKNPNYNFTQKFINDFFEKINNEKSNVTKNLSLGIDGLLRKDKKNFVWSKNFKAGWSSLEIHLDEILKKFGKKKLFERIDEKCLNEGHNIYLINYNDKFLDIKAKSIIIYNYNLPKEKFQLLNKNFETMITKICYKVEEHYDDDYIKYILNFSISRKHFEPIMRKYFNKLI
jgi:inorganic pyrophosphatase/exopolyphosphatase